MTHQVHSGFRAFTVGSTAIAKNIRVKINSSGTVEAAGPGSFDDWIGVTMDYAEAAGQVNVNLANAHGTQKMTAAGAITAYAVVYGAAGGKIDDAGSGSGIGLALESASADGDIIEVLPFGSPMALGNRDRVEVNDDFISFVAASSNEALWSNTLTDSGTVTIANVAGGILAIAASDGTIADNDEAYVATTNSVFLVAQYKPIYFETKVKLAAADSDGANVQVGLCSTFAANAILDNGAGPPASYDGVVVYKVDGGSAWQAEISVGTVQTAIALTSPGAPGTTYQVIGILVVPTSSTSATAYIYIDGVLVGSQAYTYTGSVVTNPFVGVKNGGTSVNTTLNVDYIRCSQPR